MLRADRNAARWRSRVQFTFSIEFGSRNMRSRAREDIEWGYAARGPGRGSPLVVMVALIVGAISSGAAVLALVGEPQGDSTAGVTQAPTVTTNNTSAPAPTGPQPQNPQSDDAGPKRVALPGAAPVPAPAMPSTAPPSSAKTSTAGTSPAGTPATQTSPAQTNVGVSAAAPATHATEQAIVSALEQSKSQADLGTNKDEPAIKGAVDAAPAVGHKLNLPAKSSAHRQTHPPSKYRYYHSTFSRMW
jgi:hypothetical protein